ncbi:response regulator [Paenibacillus physcomitrellae]|uniref:AraC family transcriptional regulator n=1 Tax=Paenibacillus physcomitrellae TaxID=1619311 RepID=A0ABQ1GC72_9BACL|nr:response regulator [Paenibacillus physcomitrellae]GGA40819.1 AraC family transcriptional regulator [Paenibacillus physcomitrellae]
MGELKVLIVDDEYLIRNLLRMRIDWEKQGMKIIGEAAHAAEALEFVDKHRPDVIFTDIYMPSIDGIEFSERVLKKYPDIKIVIVTGHDEFEYARKSIKIGISDFILKPIHASELLSVTEKLRKTIEEERTREKEMEVLKEELRRNLPYLKEKFLYHWLNGSLSKEEIYEKAAYFQVPMGRGTEAFQIAVMEISSVSATHTEEQLILLRMECRNKIEAFYKDNSQVIILTDTRNQIVLISQSQDNHLVSDCEWLMANLLHLGTCTVSIGIGRRHEHIEAAHLGYEEACRALHYQAFVGKNQVVCFEDIVEGGDEQYRSNTELLRQLQFYISVGSSERASQTLGQIFDVSFASVSQFRMAAMDVIMECQRAAIEQQIENEHVFDKETLVSILTAELLPQLMQSLERYVLHVAGVIYSRQEAKVGNLISQVKDYLEHNISNPEVGLASTAAAFFVSPGHLGRLMKKETGQTFVEYLTNLRMKKAEMLLKQTDLKGYEIGEQVGITDPHYFSILFKKNMGRSMNEYRNCRE